MFARLRDWIFGYDVFISYDFDEAGSYAMALKTSLASQKPPLRCFLDREGFHPSDELNTASRRRLSMSRYILVLLTEGVGKPDSWVPRELDIFTRGGQRHSDRIIPLNINQTIEAIPPDAEIRKYIPLSHGPSAGASLLYHAVPAEEFASGPSAFTIERIRSLISTRRVDQTRLRVFQAASAIMLVLFLAAATLGVIAKDRQKLAEVNAVRADNNAKQARSERDRALQNQSRLLEKEGRIKRDSGDNVGAMLLALEALPDRRSQDNVRRDRPYVPSVENLLHLAQYNRSEMAAHKLAGRPYALSPTGELLVTASAEGAVELLDVKSNTRRTLPKQHSRAITRIVFSADGAYFVTAVPPEPLQPGAIVIWDKAGHVVQKIRAESVWLGIESMAISSDGTSLVIGLRWDGILIKLDQQLVTKWLAGRQFDGVHRISFNRDGSRFVTVSNVGGLPHSTDGSPILWTSSGEQIGRLWPHSHRVNAAEFSADGSVVVTMTEDGLVSLWDATKGDLIKQRHIGLAGLCCLKRLWDQDSFVAGSEKGVVFRLSVDKVRGTEIAIDTLYSHDAAITDVATDFESKRVLSTSGDGLAKTWTGGREDKVGRCATGSAHLGRFVRSSSEIAVVCGPKSGDLLQIFSPQRAFAAVRYGPKSMRVNRVAFSGDEARVIFASEDHTAGLIRLSDGNAKMPVLFEHRSAVLDASFSANGKYVATASGDGSTRVWSVETGAPVAMLGQASLPANVAPRSVVISPEGRYAFSAMSDGTIRVWDVNAGAELHRVRPARFSDDSEISRLALNKAGTRLAAAVGSRNGWQKYTHIAVYQVDDLGGLKELPYEADMNGAPVNVKFVNNDGALLVMSEHSVELLEFNNPQQRMEKALAVPISTVMFGDAALSPNGQRLIIATCLNPAREAVSECSYAVIRDTKTTEEVGRLSGHDWYITSIDVNASGNQIATASADGTIRTWELHQTTQEFIERIQRDVPRCLTPQQRLDIFLDEQAPQWCKDLHKPPYDAN